MQLKEFKDEIGQILERYQIPMDDRSFVLDKIDLQFSSIAEAMVKKINSEREKDRQILASYEKKANETISNTVSKARESVKRAYTLGAQEASGQAKPGFSWFHIIVTGGLLVLGGIVVFREFFPKKESK